MYRRAWGLYTQFFLTFGVANIRLPLSVSNISLFIAYLYHHDYSASTATSYASAVGYIHRLANVLDPSEQFFILEMVKGYGKTVTRLDMRLPVTLPILRQFLQVPPSICTSQYVCCLFKAMCTVAFFAFLRIGEMTTSSGSSESLELHHLERLTNSSGDVVSIKIKFANFKHSYNLYPVPIVLTRRPKVCPVQSLLDYLALRGAADGALFQSLEGSPISRSFVTELLSLTVRSCGLDPTKYKGHSFRIGGGLLSQLKAGRLGPKFTSWAGGSLMLSVDIFASQLSSPNVSVWNLVIFSVSFDKAGVLSQVSWFFTW